MSTPGRVPRPRPQTGIVVQLGQTLLVLGVLVLLLGLVVDRSGSAPLIGGALAVVGAVLFAVGLRRRRHRPPDRPAA